MLMAMLDGLLRDTGYRIQDLDGIAFGKGPGSFTGVRIACGVTQGLALGANLNVVGVCTLQALAQASGHDKVIAAIDARMGEIYLAAYEKQNGAWLTCDRPCSVQGGRCSLPLRVMGWFGAGSGFGVNDAALTARYGKQLLGVDAQAVPQASAVAQLAASEFASGNAVDAALALPLYLRDKVALKTREREEARSASPVTKRTTD